ncbi:MAG: metallophosphoesterase family protein [Solirubrobacterales bacterium]|nr:metallophosphoesterase family protein [Solirubrobacterales bacterium]
MLVAVCSDVHNHTGRLVAFATAARAAGAQELWCLGDVVDALIGAPPAAHASTVAAAVELCDVVLAGNHELWCVQRGMLDAATREIVEGWSPVEERHGVGLVHASLQDPFMEFVDTPVKAARVLRETSGWLALHGHTHTRKLWAQTDAYPGAQIRPTRGTVAAGADRLLANPGALTGGRPSWLLVDLAARTLRFLPLRVAPPVSS